MERRMVVALEDCPARLVPSGTRICIPEGSFVTLTQALGGNYTVLINGNMARVDGTDAAALGLEAEVLDFPEAEGDEVDLDLVWQALKTVYDPEIPVNLVDLGLIYKVALDADNPNKVLIDMTLTAPGCGMGPVLVSDVKYRAAKVPNVAEVVVALVFDPPWSRDRMTEEAQLEAGLFF
jgi:probable FeS assembly SUF system protein SufT